MYSEERHGAPDKDSKRMSAMSTIAPLPTMEDKRKTLLAPTGGLDNRYSDIYDAYYRQSMIQGPSDSSRADAEVPAAGKGGVGKAL
jgi:hypothetical protein